MQISWKLKLGKRDFVKGIWIVHVWHTELFYTQHQLLAGFLSWFME